MASGSSLGGAAGNWGWVIAKAMATTITGSTATGQNTSRGSRIRLPRSAAKPRGPLRARAARAK